MALQPWTVSLSVVHGAKTCQCGLNRRQQLHRHTLVESKGRGVCGAYVPQYQSASGRSTQITARDRW